MNLLSKARALWPNSRHNQIAWIKALAMTPKPPPVKRLVSEPNPIPKFLLKETTMKIRTNRQPRNLVSFNDIPERKQADFDYLNEDSHYDYRFVLYKGMWRDVYESVRVPESEAYSYWDGYESTSAFSSTMFKLCPDDTVICGIATW